MSEWLVKTHRDPYEMNEKLFVAKRHEHSGVLEVITGLTVEQSTGAVFIDKPMMQGGMFGSRNEVRQFLQACMDEAWALGLKPKNFEAPTAELKAVRDHLQDMRKLAKVI